MDRDQQVLRVAYRTHHAPDRHGEGQGEQRHFRRHPVLFGQQQHQRRADHRQRVVHQECRGNPEAKQDRQDQSIRGAGTAECQIREVKQIAAFLQRLPHDKHAEQEQHDVRVNCAQRLPRTDLSGNENRHGPEQHDLPQPQAEISGAAHRDEHKHGAQDNDRNVHGNGSFLVWAVAPPPSECPDTAPPASGSSII